jgi:hypothetical protein
MTPELANLLLCDSKTGRIIFGTALRADIAALPDTAAAALVNPLRALDDDDALSPDERAEVARLADDLAILVRERDEIGRGTAEMRLAALARDQHADPSTGSWFGNVNFGRYDPSDTPYTRSVKESLRVFRSSRRTAAQAFIAKGEPCGSTR